jgi:8-oxo-dGTP pyrophosphatase MutT (NUDIX family)
MGAKPSVKSSSPARVRKRRLQVAAMCYRMRKGRPEFLLVQTRGGRWIFPKGGVEPGLTYAQSAALEAFEEAGVHGRMEQIPFTRYFRRPPTSRAALEARSKGQSTRLEAVAVHLCEVSRLEPPQESNRNPTWFSAEKAKQRLLDDRAPAFGHELARVVDRAVSRILRLHNTARLASRHVPKNLLQKDPLQEVRFQALEDGSWHNAGAANLLKPRVGAILSTAIELAMQAQLRKLTQMGAPPQFRPTVLRLGTGADSSSSKITTIDSRRKVTASNSSQLPSNKRRSPKS